MVVVAGIVMMVGMTVDYFGFPPNATESPNVLFEPRSNDLLVKANNRFPLRVRVSFYTGDQPWPVVNRTVVVPGNTRVNDQGTREVSVYVQPALAQAEPRLRAHVHVAWDLPFPLLIFGGVYLDYEEDVYWPRVDTVQKIFVDETKCAQPWIVDTN